MPHLVRVSTDYVAPPAYAVSTIAQTWGHVPFDITVYGFAADWYDDTGGGRTNSFQLWNDGAAVGDLVSVGSGFNQLIVFDTPLLIPGVTDANVDGLGRFSVQTQRLGDCEKLVIWYDPTNDADAGKSIIATGSDRLATADTLGYFAPLSYWQGDLGQQAGSGLTSSSSDVFRTPFEQTDGGHMPGDDPGPMGDNTGVAITPMVVGATLAPMLVCHDGGPGGVYSFVLRVNGADAVTITTANTSQRVWLPTGPASVDVHAGDLVCWKLGAAPGTLAGELLISATPGGAGGVLGGGESGGQY